MENTQKRPGIITGALVGLMLTAPLIIIYFLGDQLAGLPLVPFDLFDWIGRILPGEVITQGIDAIVRTIDTFNLGETSAAAKTIENVMAVGMLLGVGILGGAVLYPVVSASKNANPYLYGAGLGAGVGVIFILIFNRVNLTATADPTLSMAWIFLTFTVWGILLGWIYSDLVDLPATSEAYETVEPVPGVEATRVKSEQIDRRQFLVRVGGATATLTVLGAGVNLLVPQDEVSTVTRIEALQVGEGEVIEPSPDTVGSVSQTGDELASRTDIMEAAPGTRPEYTPLDDHYRIDISSRPPIIDAATWTLAVSGLVNAPQNYTLNQLVNDYEPVERFVTMSCISNRIAGSLISTTKWTGIQMNRLIEEWNIAPEARFLKITSADGFDEYVSLDLIREDDRIMLAYAWDDKPLKRKHGFPIRIHIPDRYGMKQPKWITDIEAVENEGEGYWVRRGWSATAFVNTTSVVDTVASEAQFSDDGQMFVPVGGIAYSGAKGISRVEVKVNDGEWQEARLREPLSDTTWYIWRYDWPFEAGIHTFTVRATTADGVLQTENERGTRPDGATGWHDVRRNVREMEIEPTPEATQEVGG